ncbi:MAG TPA: MarR family transcriptional regulator [Kofleriaceae bacterium]|nr:MarR family transcriptional regulator [Kofleriaceae bacterium]
MEDALRLEEQLCFALYNASRALTRAYAPLLEPLGVTYPQYLVLLVLWERDGLSIKQLGERLALDSGTLTPLCKRLAQQGLIERRRGDEDERLVRVHLTAAGRALRAKARKVPQGLMCAAGYDATSTAHHREVARLRDELVALTRRLDASAAIDGDDAP